MIRRGDKARRATATVELAILLPFLAIIFFMAVDYGRIFYYTQVLDNCARNGAAWLADSNSATKSPYLTVTAAAQADASNLSTLPSVSSSSGTDANNHPWVKCTVTWTFTTVVNYPGVPSSVSLTRSCQMRTQN
jgi:Flp pilus assembly protein TadG